MSLRHLAYTAFILSLSAAIGCSEANSSGGNTGGGGANTGGGGANTGGGGGQSCTVPTAEVPLSVPMTDPNMPYAVTEADGAFEAAADGFKITNATDSFQIFGVTPAVPNGTLVHVSFAVTQGFYGPQGAFVRVDNLDALDGQNNPTEAGTRLWYYAASGGGDNTDLFPFTLTPEEVCTAGDFESGTNTVQSLKIEGPGFTTTVLPGQQGGFGVDSGVHAGGYVLENVNVQWVGAMGGDAWTLTNLTVKRSP